MSNDGRSDDNTRLTRRRAVVAGAAGAAAVGLGVSTQIVRGDGDSDMVSEQPTSKQPVIYVPHGGGPFSYVDFGIPEHEVKPLADYWISIGERTPRPTGLLVISAHWEQPLPTIMTAPHPPMLYDYSGFPAAAYDIQWPAPGSTTIATRVGALLEAAGISSATDASRGFDHGTFVPLKRSFPDADVPCVQLSLQAGLDVQTHIAIGAALAPLRDEGVLIVGSGMSYHNMRGFRIPDADGAAEAFDRWLQQSVSGDANSRTVALENWTSAPHARDVHPREEHLAPLFVVAGAAGDDAATFPFSGAVMGKKVSAVHFGA